MSKKFILPLLNARRNYDVAHILNENSLLDKLIIDAYYNKYRYPLFLIIDKMLPIYYVNNYKKYSPNIQSDKIISSWLTSIIFKFRMHVNKSGDYYKSQINAYKSLNSLTIDFLSKHQNENYNIYSLDTASVELFRWVRKKRPSTKLYLEQCVAPRTQQLNLYLKLNTYTDEDRIKKQKAHFDLLGSREKEEWELADKIIVPSEYVKKCVLSENINYNKIHLIPYGYDSLYSADFLENNLFNKFEYDKKVFKILFVGNSGYRKGLHDIIAIAKRLANLNVEFLIAGKIEQNFIIPTNLSNVTFLGKLDKSQLDIYYSQVDIFLFPSYLEGSALVTYEAMSWGLPIVTTTEAGSVVRNNVDGYIVQSGFIDDFVHKIQNLIFDRQLRKDMAFNSLNRIKEYSILNYTNRLLHLLKN